MSGEKRDVNKATADQLADLPGIGKALAARVVKHRETEGPFEDMASLAEVRGISDEMAGELEQHLEVRKADEPPEPEKPSKPEEPAKPPEAEEKEASASPKEAEKKADAGKKEPAKAEERVVELRAAARTGDVKALKSLIAAGADAQDKFALIWAAQAGHNEVVTLLVEGGADVNAQAGGGTNALELAAQNGHITVVETLIAAGADPNAPGIEGWTPLMKAAYFDHNDAVEALLAAGADRRARNSNGHTPLALAQSADNLQAVSILSS